MRIIFDIFNIHITPSFTLFCTCLLLIVVNFDYIEKQDFPETDYSSQKILLAPFKIRPCQTCILYMRY